MRVGIVGSRADKFETVTKERAKALISELLTTASVLVSGGSPGGGVDIWAEEIAKKLGITCDIKTPKQLSWDGSFGFRARNIAIARDADVVHVIVVKKYPVTYNGARSPECYHCKTTEHIKSGGCWTGWYARRNFGKRVVWHTISEDGNVSRSF